MVIPYKWNAVWDELRVRGSEAQFFWIPTVMLYFLAITAIQVLKWLSPEILVGPFVVQSRHLMYLLVGYTVWSYRWVKTPKVGSKILFGRAIQHVNPGLVFCPRGLCTLVLEPGNIVQIEISPTRKDPEDPAGKKFLPDNKRIEQSKDGSLVYVAENESLHIVSASPQTAELADYVFAPEDSRNDPKKITAKSQKERDDLIQETKEALEEDLTHEKMTLEPAAVIEVKILHHPTLINEKGSLKQAVQQIEKRAVSEISNQFGRWTPAMITSKLDVMDARLRNAIEWEIGEPTATPPLGREPSDPTDHPHFWGLDLRVAEIKYPGIPRRVSESQADLVKTRNDSKGNQIKADVEAYQIAKTGQARADAERAKIEAETAALAKQMAQMGLTGPQAIAARVAAESATGTQKIVVGINGVLEEATSLLKKTS